MSDMMAVKLDRATPEATQLLGKLVEDLRLSGLTVSHSMVFYNHDAASPVYPLSAKELPSLGAPFGGGFFAGVHDMDGGRYALIVAPKTSGERMDVQFKSSDRGTPDKTIRDDDGLANSNLINDDNHPAAQFCRSLNISNHNDWYLPSRDELSMIERNLGPKREKTPDLFKPGAEQAFEERWYWSSTEYASNPDFAWLVGFNDDFQYDTSKDDDFAVRAVRRLPI